ncbi:carboxypeptidase-like regulatory domain-containing protein [Formosa sp. PL04]|uniref:carboxypeptidase-like regulatory domain-containing protein n=1 Tax=Formosa sp. PL04 TaxID=3081755 RepID=UPI002980F0CC|nr:carboxypeptidase-like regulatory domain-containing protein [Formosa sp. PL04]MDW5290441.1 carboxypeptidase-like regulatory domain-containing protein [Formosa sp. PL04]
MKIEFMICCCIVGCVSQVKAQNLELISGVISGDDDVENIHVINKTSKRFTVTNAKGAFFIEAKLNDTIVFTAVQYTTKEIIVKAPNLLSKTMYVFLSEDINVLSEVVVGKVLTGDLLLDIGNFETTRDINFYDVGIPGYTGKRKTQEERRLFTAGEFKPIMLLGLLGGSLPIDPILNAISGRTKMLKSRIELEENEALVKKIKHNLSDDFFSDHPLSEFKQMDFWYFCIDDPDFKVRCYRKSDIEILAFLKEKYLQYIDNSNSTSN